MTVLGAQGVEEGTQQVGDLYLEGARARVACVGVVAEGSCCSQVGDTSGAGLAAGSWKEEEVEGLEAVLQAADRRGGDTAVLGVHSWAAWAHRRELLFSSSTEGSGNLLQTCRSCWWT